MQHINWLSVNKGRQKKIEETQLWEVKCGQLRRLNVRTSFTNSAYSGQRHTWYRLKYKQVQQVDGSLEVRKRKIELGSSSQTRQVKSRQGIWRPMRRTQGRMSKKMLRWLRAQELFRFGNQIVIGDY